MSSTEAAEMTRTRKEEKSALLCRAVRWIISKHPTLVHPHHFIAIYHLLNRERVKPETDSDIRRWREQIVNLA